MKKVKLGGIYRLKKTGEEIKVVSLRVGFLSQPIVGVERSDFSIEYLYPQDLEKIPEKWKPKMGKPYYILYFDISDEGVEEKIWSNTSFDKQRLEQNRAFPTKQEAESARDKVRELLLSLKK